MEVKFDSLNRFETPKFYLCNPGSVYNADGTITNVVGILPDTTDEEIVFNFNALSELSLRVPRVTRSDPEENQYTQKLYRAVQNRRHIFVEDVGFFVISSVSDCYDGEIHYKDVKAESCEVELQNRCMTYIPDGTYCLKDSTLLTGEDSQTMVSMIQSALPLWSFGDIDDSLDGRYRTFEDVSTDTNILSFILNDVQEAYECLFVFDIIHRIIHVYDQGNYVRQTSIHITKDDLVTDLEIQEDASDLYTAITVLGCDNLGISAINPLGTNVVMNFDYYLDWMSDGLGDKVRAWTETLAAQTAQTDIQNRTIFNGVEYPPLPIVSDDGTDFLAMYPYIILYVCNGVTMCAMSPYPFYATDFTNDEGYTSTFVLPGAIENDADEETSIFEETPTVIYSLTDGEWRFEEINIDNKDPSNTANDLGVLSAAACIVANSDGYAYIQWANHDIMQVDLDTEYGPTTLDFLLYHDGSESDSLYNTVYFNGTSSSTVTYYDISLRYYQLLTKQSNLQSEYWMYESRMDMYKRCYDNIVADGDTSCVESYNESISENYTSADDAAESDGAISIADDVNETLTMLAAQITAAADKCTEIQAKLTELDAYISRVIVNLDCIRNALAMSSYFTADEYNELANYRFEGSYTDDFIAVTDIMTYEERFAQMKTLYDRAVNQLKKISYPTQEFSADIENFVFSSKFQEWSDELETGCLVNVELERDDVAALFLTTIAINYYDHTLQMTFGNRYNRYDPKALFTDALGNIKKSANTIEYIKDILSPIKSGEFDAMKEALENSRTLTKTAVLASSNQDIIIDDTGFTGRKLKQDGSGEYEDEQVKLVNNALVFTSNGWDTCHTALGTVLLPNGETVYGINAETIMGDMIIGGALNIVTSDGENKTGILEVMDGKIRAEVSDGGATGDRLSVLEQTADDLTLSFTSTKTEDGDIRYSANSVTTESNYTFNKDGLFIQESGEDLINQIDNSGMYVMLQADSEDEDDTIVLAANYKGVMALNLSSSQYLIVGESSRFEDYLVDRTTIDAEGNTTTYTEKRTGCYFIEDFTFDDVVTIEEE